MKKLIALISAIAVMGSMSLTSLAAITATPAENATLAAVEGGYSAALTSAETNTQTTILAVKGAEITTSSIQYINQLTQDSEVAINFDLKDALAVGETVNVYMGGDAINKTLVGTIANVADPVEKFTVKFVSEGATLSEVAYDKDAAIVVPENPTKAADASYTYAFAGWYVEGDAEQTVVDLTDAKATANVTYVAKFTATAIPVEPEEPTYILGDVYVDESVDDLDIMLLDYYYADMHDEIDSIFGSEHRFWEDDADPRLLAADVYTDGSVDDLDIMLLDYYYADMHDEIDSIFGPEFRFWE